MAGRGVYDLASEAGDGWKGGSMTYLRRQAMAGR